ncbi:MAG TPA: permease-like cell division protein FtsX [Thermodesulfobacteriota bacterium]|nr:permease-like cell division protein FtsX [Thermodesulfobacteriota bacterium]
MKGYFFRQAWQNLTQNPWLNAITLGTITLSFLILGLFLIIFLNTKGLMAEWGGRIRITVYLAGSMNQEQITRLQGKIRGFDEVQEVSYRSKDEALKVLEAKMPERKEMLRGLPRNPLPASLEIRLKGEYQNSEGVRTLVKRLQGATGVEDIQYGSDWLDRFSAFMVLLKILGWGLGGLLLLATIFVISNTIRLNIFARREEIEIMRSVGATGLFIRAPFYLEGILQGLLGAVFALAMLFAFFQLFLSKVYEPMKSLLGNFPAQFLNSEEMAAVALGGVILGLLGTQVSVGRYLRI